MSEQTLIHDVVAWQRETFPTASLDGVMRHFHEEVKEFHDAVLYGTDDAAMGEEAADVLLLLIAICDKLDIDLMWEARNKLDKNKARVWAPAAGGYSKHVEAQP